MNSKRTNRIVVILNAIAIVTYYIIFFSGEYLLSSMMIGESNESRSIYNNGILDLFLSNLQTILIILYSGIGIVNIICAIQNKENKKIFFWQLVFGIYEIFIGVSIGFLLQEESIVEVATICINAISIILAIINLVKIKKNKPKVIQILSYVAVIIISILAILNIIGLYWHIISVIMQFIYIHFQDKNIEESKSRKITNIIIYYILQGILVGAFFLMTIYSLLITKINDDKWQNGLNDLYNKITTLQGSQNSEIYIPVENSYKYGFITENGKEKIPCQYDRVTYFNEIEINNNTYYIALAKKDNKFYIISKQNNYIELNDDLEKYMQTMFEQWGDSITSTINEEKNYRLAYLQSFEFFLQALNKNEKLLKQQILETNMYSVDSEVFSNGFVRYENEDKTQTGWYDDKGNKILIPNNYRVLDIKNNKIILIDESQKEEQTFIILDMTGKKLLKTTALDIYTDTYLIKNSNKKMVIVDNEFREISKEYDKIITTMQIDISKEYCSYY